MNQIERIRVQIATVVAASLAARLEVYKAKRPDTIAESVADDTMAITDAVIDRLFPPTADKAPASKESRQA